jgi:predicted RecB family endonuclease
MPTHSFTASIGRAGIGTQEQHGEIDIVIVNQAGDVLLIEVKSGDVDFTSEGIFKTYGGSCERTSLGRSGCSTVH